MIKKLRFVIQLTFFIIFILLILNIITNTFTHDLFNALQIFPFLAWIVNFELIHYWFISFILLLSVLIVGRVYCSYICPVGFLQDLIRNLSIKINSKLSRITKDLNSNLTINSKSNFPNNDASIVIRKIILFFCLTMIFLKSSLYGYFDHFANYIRLIGIFNLSFLTLPLYLAIIFLFLLFLSIRYPRWFCQVICPTGTLFSFLQKYSRLKITISETCNNCPVCSNECPVLCINHGNIDHQHCIQCFECLNTCPQEEVSLHLALPKFKKKSTPLVSDKIVSEKKTDSLPLAGEKKPTIVVVDSNINKRNFFRLITSASTGIAAGATSKKYLFKDYQKDSLQTVLPPSANSAEQFFKLCTFCSQCISVCPTNVLIPSGLENGPHNLSKPAMNYNQSYCSYECNVCLSVCPTKALTYYPLEYKKQIKIGTAELNEDTCIPYVDKKECGACAEHCPTGAITSQEKDQILVPIFDERYCIGCGNCQCVCPVEPIRAIIVKPEERHKIAYTLPEGKKPSSKKAPIDGSSKDSSTTDSSTVEEFPF